MPQSSFPGNRVLQRGPTGSSTCYFNADMRVYGAQSRLRKATDACFDSREGSTTVYMYFTASAHLNRTWDEESQRPSCGQS